MVYKYVFVPGVILNLYILASYLIPCDVLHKWGYCTSPNNQGIPCFNRSVRVVKIYQLLQMQMMPGSKVP